MKIKKLKKLKKGIAISKNCAIINFVRKEHTDETKEISAISSVGRAPDS